MIATASSMLIFLARRPIAALICIRFWMARCTRSLITWGVAGSSAGAMSASWKILVSRGICWNLLYRLSMCSCFSLSFDFTDDLLFFGNLYNLVVRQVVELSLQMPFQQLEVYVLTYNEVSQSSDLVYFSLHCLPPNSHHWNQFHTRYRRSSHHRLNAAPKIVFRNPNRHTHHTELDQNHR